MWRKRKNAGVKVNYWRWPVTVFGFYLLGLWGWLTIKVDPVILADVWMEGMYLPYLVVLWGGVMGIVYGLTNSIWRSLGWSIGVVVFLLLRLFDLGNILNGLLILSLLITMEFVLRNKPK